MDGGEGERRTVGGIRTDLRGLMSHGEYLDLGTPLSAERPRSRRKRHDELLFIVAHQTSMPWLQLVLQGLGGARERFTVRGELT